MSGQPVANADSTGSHGGGFTITTFTLSGSSMFGRAPGNTVAFNAFGTRAPVRGALYDNDIRVLRVGDIYNCPIHGSNPVVTGSAVWFDCGRAIVRLGDTTACGATVTPPVSPEWDSQ